MTALEQAGGPERFNLTLHRKPFFLYPGGQHAIEHWGDRVDALYRPTASRDLSALGASAGFEFDMSAPLSDTMDSHRLVLWADRTEPGLGERVAQAVGIRYFERAMRLADRAMLAECAEEAGLERAAAARFLESGEGYEEVRQAVADSARDGVHSIPEFRFRSGSYARHVHGSADVATFASVLREVEAHWAAARELAETSCPT